MIQDLTPGVRENPGIVGRAPLAAFARPHVRLPGRRLVRRARARPQCGSMDTVSASTTLLGDAPVAGLRRASVPTPCEPGNILRALLGVQVIVTAGAAFGSGSLAAWLGHVVVGAAVSVPATLAWLVICCWATGLLVRLPAVGRLACAA